MSKYSMQRDSALTNFSLLKSMVPAGFGFRGRKSRGKKIEEKDEEENRRKIEGKD